MLHAGTASAATVARTPVRSPAAAARGDPMLLALLFAVVASCLLLQRFALNAGAYALSLAVPVLYALLAWAVLNARVQVAPVRLAFVLATAGVAVASLWLNGHFAGVDRSSIGSLALLMLFYLPLAFTLAPARTLPDGAAERVWAFFIDLAFFCALAGIVQFSVQFVFKPEWLFDFTPLIPAPLQGPEGYNTVIPVGDAFKSNGFFFREPSGYSLAMALGLMAEWLRARRWWRLGTLALALLLSYSGTGLLALLIGLLFPLGLRTVARLLAFALGGLLVWWLLGDWLNLSFTADRVQEFGSERSSAYIRYVAPWRLVGDTFATTPWSAWIGHGPGSISRATAGYAFHDPTWAKLLHEYGLLGFLAVNGLVLAVLQASTAPLPLRAMLFFSWLLMGGHLLTPESIHLAFVLTGLLAAAPRATHAGGTPPAAN